MTTITEITSVIERVEKGETGLHVNKAVLAATCTMHAYHFDYPNGERVQHEDVSTDLDAVHALHKRVLPGWVWWKEQNGEFHVAVAVGAEESFFGPWDESRVNDLDDPAKWLIAILTAKRAQMEAGNV